MEGDYQPGREIPLVPIGPRLTRAAGIYPGDGIHGDLDNTGDCPARAIYSSRTSLPWLLAAGHVGLLRFE
jgi:hypothetical protein